MNKPTAAAQAASRLAGPYRKPAAYDADDEALRLEFAPLALTADEEMMLADVLRLRLGSRADQIEGSRLLIRLRDQLDASASAIVDEAKANGARGVGRDSKSQAFRILDRDGLNQLCVRGHVTRPQLEAGLAYRKRYEMAFKGLRSTLGTQASGVSPTVDEMVASRTRLARYELERAKVEAAVVRHCGAEALGLLRTVAGEGCALSSQVSGTRSKRTFGKASLLLAGALDICAELLPK